MKLVELQTENVMRVKAVEVRPAPGGGLVIISGRNGVGKSSVLASIEMAFGGEKAVPGEPIRRGEETARIQALLDDEDVKDGPWKVRRRFTAKGSYLQVENVSGATFKSPQKLLDSLLGDFTFDPLAFSRLPAREQRDALLKIVDLGIDLDAHEAERQRLYDGRTAQNREVKRLKGALVSLPEAEDGVPDEEVLMTALAEELQQAHAQDTENRNARAEWGVLKADVGEVEEEVAALAAELLAAQKRVAQAYAALAKQEDFVGTLVDVDEEPIRAKMQNAEQINAQVRGKKARAQAVSHHKAAMAMADQSTNALEALDAKKRRALQNAAFPVDGLGLTAEGVTYNDLPFDQAAQSEKLRVSVAIAMAANPTLRIIRIDDGSLLDAENMQQLQALAQEHDYDIWIERVTDGEPVGIVIEDGQVLGAEIADGTDG